MDKEYFENYAREGKVTSYQETWKESTMDYVDFEQFFQNFLNFKPKTFFDVGAADGSVMQWLKDDFGFTETGGIEIYHKIVQDSPHEEADHIIIGDVTETEIPYTYDRKLWDVTLVGGVYIPIKGLEKLFQDLKQKSKYVVFIMQSWDGIRFEKPPYKETVLESLNFWLQWIDDQGYDIVCMYNDTFLLKMKDEFSDRYTTPQKMLTMKDIALNREGFIAKYCSGTFAYDEDGDPVLQVSGSTRELPKLNNFLMSLDVGVEYTSECWSYIPGWYNRPDGSLVFARNFVV